MSQTFDAVIIGGGLTGSTLAYYLKKAGLKIKILEKKDRLGGVINTITEEGFTYETGPNSGVLASPEAVLLFEKLKDKCEIEYASEQSNNRWILKNGEWHALPTGLFPAIKTPLFSLKDKIGILFEPLKAKGSNPEESVSDLVKRRLGRSFLDFAIDPFISGIYAGNPDRLITKYALPKLYNLEQTYGSFIKGAIKKKFEPKSELDKKVNKKVFSVKGGLHYLISSLTADFESEEIAFNVEKVSINGSSFDFKVEYETSGVVSSINSKYVITTTSAYELPKMFTEIEKEKLEIFNQLHYTKVVQVILGYKEWKGIELNAFGGLIPSLESKKSLGILFPSSIFSGRAPKGGSLLSVFLGGEKNPDFINLKNGEIKELVLKEVEDLLKTNAEPDLMKVIKYQKAIPQYEINSRERFSTIEEIERTYQGLILAGNIRNGIGMSDRIAQATNVAEIIINGF